MTVLDYDEIQSALEENFQRVEQHVLSDTTPEVPEETVVLFDAVFSSSTQAYREVLLGCILAKMCGENVDIRLPYAKLGTGAYSGRTLDENVVNPFLHRKRIPCSKGPFLSVFRRSVKFDKETRSGLRDKAGYDAFLDILGRVESSNRQQLVELLRYHLWRFVQLRSESQIEVVSLRRVSLSQIEQVISGLLRIQSGGRLPLFLVVAAFRAVKRTLNLSWEVEHQGINVADVAAGATGDITITENGDIVLAAEVTERQVERSRVVSTFNTKIAPHSIEDYLFFVGSTEDVASAIEQAKQYFSQGHEVNFVEIQNWILMVLALLGTAGRGLFLEEMVAQIGADEVPVSIKLAWNDLITGIASGGSG